jgi:hypothetical protein
MSFKNKILKILWSLSIFSLISSFLFTIFQSASFAREFYRIRSFKNEIERIEKENSKLEAEFSNLNSLNNLDGVLGEFVKVKEVKYIKISRSWIVER